MQAGQHSSYPDSGGSTGASMPTPTPTGNSTFSYISHFHSDKISPGLLAVAGMGSQSQVLVQPNTNASPEMTQFPEVKQAGMIDLSSIQA